MSLTLAQTPSISVGSLSPPAPATPTGYLLTWNGTNWVAQVAPTISQNLNMSGYSIVNLSNGTSVAPSLSFNSNASCGIYSSASNSLDFVTNGLQCFTINPSGKLSSDTASYETLVVSANDIPNKTYVDSHINNTLIKSSELISVAGALSTSIDSILDSRNSSYTVTLGTSTADQIKTIRLLRRRSLPVTVSCVSSGGGSFNLTATEPSRILRYMSAGYWHVDTPNPATGSTSFYPTTQQGSKLVGTGATGASQQGQSVSLSADGNTLAIGGYGDNTNAGATWIFIRSGSTWSQQGSKLVGTGAIGTSFQGVSVSLSSDGNTLAVGGPQDNTNIGATWIFTRSAGVWTQQGSKLIGTGATGAAQQGQSVSLSADGNTLAVGGYHDNTNIGATWIFTRSASVWTQQGSKLIGTGYTGTPYQSYSVSLSADGNTLAVGGYQDNSSVGAAWIFTRSAGVWTQQGAKLVGTGYSGTPSQGASVSISADGNTLAIGGYGNGTNVGATWVFTRSGGVWSQQGSKLTGTGNTGSSYQGQSVSLSADGNTLVIGGYQDNASAGAIWIFTRSAGVWSQQGNKFVGTGATGAANQGYSASLSANGNTLAIGGVSDNTSVGATWIFT